MPILDFLIDNLTSLKKTLEKKKKRRKSLRTKKKVIPKKKKTASKTKKTVVKKLPKSAKTKSKKTTKKKVSKKAPAKKKALVRKSSAKKSPSQKKKTKTAKKIVKKTVLKNSALSTDVVLGDVTHFFSKIKVAVINVTHSKISIGDQICIEGATSKFKMTIKSMQIESVDVKLAKKGQIIGLKTPKPVRVGDKVYKA